MGKRQHRVTAINDQGELLPKTFDQFLERSFNNFVYFPAQFLAVSQQMKVMIPNLWVYASPSKVYLDQVVQACRYFYFILLV